jgi:hypothetical protein
LRDARVGAGACAWSRSRAGASATDTAGTDADVIGAQLVRHPLRPLCRVLERVVQASFLGRNAVRVGAAGPTLLLDEVRHATHLEGAPDLVERVAVVAHDLAGLGDIAGLLGELEQGELPSSTLRNGGHLVFAVFGVWRFPKYPRDREAALLLRRATCRTNTRLGHASALNPAHLTSILEVVVGVLKDQAVAGVSPRNQPMSF